MHDPIQFTKGKPIRFGDYIIHRVIGEGGMARVYEGEEVLSHRRVAVKVLRTEFAHSEDVRRRFLQEMAILAHLDHPNIVRCLLCTAIEGRPVMVLELLEGWTLRQMLDARVALPWAEALGYAAQIAAALQAAHSQSPPIVHRDLKPENVMCLPDGRVKVMDFGIAKILRSMNNTTNHEVGTLQYMSPEQIDAAPLDSRADLFALGLVMWEMLAGHPPFAGRSPRELLDRICTQPTPRLPDQAREGLPPQIEALIERLLQKRPEARPSSAAEVLSLLAPTSTAWTKPASAPTEPRQPVQAPLHTMEIVQGAQRGPMQHAILDHAERITDEVGRFAQATSAWIVRVLLALLVMPAAAVLFVGVPFMLTALGVHALGNAGVSIFESSDPIDDILITLLIHLLLVTVVFVRACWAHRRPPSKAGWAKPWLAIGGLLIAGWVATTAIEFAPKNTLDPKIHEFFINMSGLWIMLSMAWATGRFASRLFRRLERPPAQR